MKNKHETTVKVHPKHNKNSLFTNKAKDRVWVFYMDWCISDLDQAHIYQEVSRSQSQDF